MVRVRVNVLDLGKEGGREGWSGLGLMAWNWERREGGREGRTGGREGWRDGQD